MEREYEKLIDDKDQIGTHPSETRISLKLSETRQQRINLEEYLTERHFKEVKLRESKKLQ